MFTGCIEAVAHVVQHDVSEESTTLILRSDLAEAVSPGDRIAVNGVCLTVQTCTTGNRQLTFHLLHETATRTNLSDLAPGRAVNLERAVCVGDRLDGHMVSGHIDCTSPITAIKPRGADTVVTVMLPDDVAGLVVEKGSIAIDGISLTIAELAPATFSVHIIPYTRDHTTIGTARPGRHVNLEFDMVGKYIQRQQEMYRRSP